ncbi:ATP-binding protein [Candidatus Pacearchaeota archaeon]|nr:ATP-binding protein [Candidatus Pacearchaeota archaeon]
MRTVSKSCRCLMLYCSQERFKLLKDKAGMEGYEKLTFATYKAQHPTQRQALDIIRGYKKIKGFYLHGKVGRGKTHLMAATVHEATKRGIASLIVSAPKMLMKLNTIPFDELESLMAAFENIPYLVIDDIGKERLTDHKKEMMFTILDARWRRSEAKKGATSFTGQLSPDKLKDKGYDDAMISRIQGMVQVMKIDGENRR